MIFYKLFVIMSNSYKLFVNWIAFNVDFGSKFKRTLLVRQAPLAHSVNIDEQFA
jgi:hypothetical protein